MAKKQIEDHGDKNLGNIESALSRTELFIENNSKLLTNILFGILALVLLVIAGNRYIIQPKNVEASSNMFMAEKYFEQDSFNLALNGYGTFPGFVDIIDDYGFTKSAKLAKYYAGICSKELGDYEAAIDFLSSFTTKDLQIGATAASALGDSYSELEDYSNAVRAYLVGANKFENNFTSPIILKKAGIVYEEMGEFDLALKMYNRISSDYPDSSEGREMKKYIGRVEARIVSL